MKTGKMLFGLFMIFLLLQGCLNDDLQFPESQPDRASNSLSLITYLNAFSNADNTCFEFIYPITVEYSNGLVVKISNKDGLEETINSQRPNFHMKGISFPFMVSIDDQLQSIENETDFLNVLSECGIKSPKDKIKSSLTQCFDFVYPVTFLDLDSNEFEINEASKVFDLLDQASQSEQPTFLFPLEVFSYPDDETITISNYFELLDFLKVCTGCPEVSFTYNDSNDFSYRFEASVNVDEASLSWYINEEVVKTTDQSDKVLEKTFVPGTYTICLKAKTDVCQLGSVYCETITIEPRCPDLHFEPVQDENLNVYTFQAEFPNMTNLESYSWYINEEFVKEERGNERDNQLFWQFETGIHEVCLRAENDQCPNGATYCEEIAAGCLPVDFTSEEETYGFVLTPSFEGSRLVTYIWKVYENDVLIDESVREPSAEDPNYVLDEMEPGVTYEVCLKQDGDCLEQQVCKSFSMN